MKQVVHSPIKLLSVVVPARDEEGCIASTVERLHAELQIHQVPHEIIVVDDGSQDRTRQILEEIGRRIPELRLICSEGPYGIGVAIQRGLARYKGDAVVIMMADESDDCRDVVRYWRELNQGHDCVFGSRFLRGSGVIGYPRIKRILNRAANLFLGIIFGYKLNDTTNAFKAYRRTVIDGCQPLSSPHFSILVELPLKAIVRGFSWTVIPISWRGRGTGETKLKIKEMAGRYFFICCRIWVEKYFLRGVYKKASRAQGC